jgi:hypothetical protein
MNFKSSIAKFRKETAEFRKETAEFRKEFPLRPSAKFSATLCAMDFKEATRKHQRPLVV